MSKIKIIYGIHAVSALLNRMPQQIIDLLVQENRVDQRLHILIEKANNLGVKIIYLSLRELNALIEEKHQGIIAEYQDFRKNTLERLLKNRSIPALVLVLDGVKDPHNLGACLRSANAFNVQVVIAPKDRAVSITHVVRKVACGAAEITPFMRMTNLSRTIDWLKKEGIWIIGTAMDAKYSIQEIDLKGDIAIVLGSEGEGMRRLTREQCDFLVQIPLSGSVGNLNVSVACGICLYEVQRQRFVERR